MKTLQLRSELRIKDRESTQHEGSMAYQPTPLDDSPPPSFEQSRVRDGVPQRAASPEMARKPMGGYGERVRAAEEYAMGDLEEDAYGRRSLNGSYLFLNSHPHGSPPTFQRPEPMRIQHQNHSSSMGSVPQGIIRRGMKKGGIVSRGLIICCPRDMVRNRR
jgi:hypothetical protein